MSVSDEGDKAVQAAAAFHTWHSSRTWNPGHPQLDPWMRDVLLNLQLALNTISASQKAIAEQVDANTRAIQKIARYLDSKS